MDVAQLDITRFLSSDEQKLLKKMNLASNKLTKTLLKNNNLFNISLKVLFQNWSTKMKDIILDVTLFISKIGKGEYSHYFNDIDNTSSWISGIWGIFKDLVYIFIKEQRPMYFGVSIIIFGFLLFIFQISS